MVDRFSSYFDSTRKILNTKLGEFSFFLPSWMKIFMHTWSCTLFDALTIFRSMSLSTMSCYLFYRSSFLVLSVPSLHPNPIGQIARFTQLIFYFLSHIVTKSHTWQGMLCYICVCFFVSASRVWDLFHQHCVTIKSVYLHRSKDLHATFVPYSLPITPSFLSD